MLAERISAGSRNMRSGAGAIRDARAARIAGLYAVLPECADTRRLVALAVAAVEGGASLVQYRNKTLDARSRLAQARAVAAAPAVRRALFIVNDEAGLAREVDADGVHLGEDDGSIADARAHIGPEGIIGVSCYGDFDRARAAVDDGADYVAFGSFFASAVKPDARHAPIGLLGRARTLGVPVVAIGGITATNAATLIGAGADALAVISDVFAHDDIADVTRAASAIARAFRHEP